MTIPDRNITAGAGPGTAAPGFEPRDVPPRGVVYALLGLFAGIAIALGAVAGLFTLLEGTLERPHPTALETTRQTPPPPRLEIEPAADRAALEAAARRRLEGYGWADREAGLAHIPIARAMRLLAEHGWPDVEDGDAARP